MRYTTIIDISKSEVYRNPNARLVYLHLCLVAGYHDTDRDLVRISIRQLAAQVGLTLSATRFAVAQLEKNGLLAHTESVWRVKKWFEEQTITSRKKSAQEARKAEKEKTAADARRKEAEKQEEESQRLEAIRSTGKTPFEEYFEGKMAEAAAGDLEAQEIVNKRKWMYDQLKNQKQ